MIQLTPEFFQGAVTIEQTDEYCRPWRTDYRQQDLFPSPENGLLDRMGCPAGVRIRFTCASDSVTLSTQPSGSDRLFDLVIDNELRETRTLPAGETDISFHDLPGDMTPAEIWPGYLKPTYFTGIQGDNVQPANDTRLKWLTYGSSISQCNGANSPARSWPAVAARECNLNLTSLGFAGQCQIDSMIARLIRDRDVDLITLKLGINVMGGCALSPRTFKGAVIGFIQIIREKHPNVPIGVISPIICPPRETELNAVGLCLTAMREDLADAVDRIKRVTGDNHLFYFNGLDLFGESLVSDYLPDLLHPNGDGYEIMGRNAVSILTSLMSSLPE